MHYSCQAFVLAALALEAVVATPHLRHLHLHKERDLSQVDWSDPSIYDVNWSTVNYGKSAAATPTAQAAAAPKDKIAVAANSPAETGAATSSAPATSSGTSSGGSGSCIDISKVWTTRDTSKGGKVAADYMPGWTDRSTATKKRATAEQDGYVGNTGTTGNQGGSSQPNNNIVPLSNCDDQSHDYTIKFTNSKPSGKLMYLALWNKVATDGGALGGPFVNSFFYVPLEAGQSVAFAFAPNSQIAFSEAGDEVCSRTEGAPGGWDCIWGEANIGPPGGFTSWDVSILYNKSAPGDLSISSFGSGDVSSRSFCNFSRDDQQYAGEFVENPPCSPNVVSGPAHLHAQFGINLSRGQH